MLDHLEIIVVMALVPWGAFIAMREGMVLEWWYNLWKDRSQWIAKPLATCSRCMVSAWGIPAAILTFPDLNYWALPAYALAAVAAQEWLDR